MTRLAVHLIVLSIICIRILHLTEGDTIYSRTCSSQTHLPQYSICVVTFLFPEKNSFLSLCLLPSCMVELSSYRMVYQCRLWQVCAFTQACRSLRCLYIHNVQIMEEVEGHARNQGDGQGSGPPPPWKIVML